jgi:hypothetical protein
MERPAQYRTRLIWLEARGTSVYPTVALAGEAGVAPAPTGLEPVMLLLTPLACMIAHLICA